MRHDDQALRNLRRKHRASVREFVRSLNRMRTMFQGVKTAPTKRKSTSKPLRRGRTDWTKIRGYRR